jgi:hypothetical protein
LAGRAAGGGQGIIVIVTSKTSFGFGTIRLPIISAGPAGTKIG